MDVERTTSEFIDFLSVRGCVSHILSAPEGSTISTLALTQRCLASGINFPVPLPDGSVAIRVDGQLPVSLSALDLVIEDVAARGAGDMPETPIHEAPADGAPSDVDPLSESVAVPASEQEMITRFERVIESGSAACAGNTEDKGIPVDGVEMDAAWDEDLPEEVEAGETGDAAPMFVRSAAHDMPASVDSGTVAAVANHPGADDIEAPSAPLAEGLDERFDDAEAPEATASFQPTPETVASDDTESLMRILGSLAEIEDRLESISAVQGALAQRLEDMSHLVEEIAARPLPRPDTADFNRGMARLTTVFAQAVRRIETAVDGMVNAANGERSQLSGLVRDALSDLAGSAAGGKGAQAISASDLTMIASMQETMSHQLAKLLEMNQDAKPPQLEEFLLDLRHATAELLAEQARLAKAG